MKGRNIFREQIIKKRATLSTQFINININIIISAVCKCEEQYGESLEIIHLSTRRLIGWVGDLTLHSIMMRTISDVPYISAIWSTVQILRYVTVHTDSFSAPFRGFRKIADCDYYLRNVCPSVRMKQPASQSKDFHEILYLYTFRKSVEEFQVSLKSDMNKGYFTWNPVYTYNHISLTSSSSKIRFRQKL